MATHLFAPQPTIIEALTAAVAGEEIVLRGATTATPTFTPAAARLTGQRLIAAAEQLEKVARPQG